MLPAPVPFASGLSRSGESVCVCHTSQAVPVRPLPKPTTQAWQRISPFNLHCLAWDSDKLDLVCVCVSPSLPKQESQPSPYHALTAGPYHPASVPLVKGAGETGVWWVCFPKPSTQASQEISFSLSVSPPSTQAHWRVSMSAPEFPGSALCQPVLVCPFLKPPPVSPFFHLCISPWALHSPVLVEARGTPRPALCTQRVQHGMGKHTQRTKFGLEDLQGKEERERWPGCVLSLGAVAHPQYLHCDIVFMYCTVFMYVLYVSVWTGGQGEYTLFQQDMGK